MTKVPDNIFMCVIKNEPEGKATKVHYRDDKYIVFDDKFGVSDNHLDIIPIEVIKDITVLKKEHVSTFFLHFFGLFFKNLPKKM